MQTSFRLGRVAGVEIGANWSWLFVVALIIWVLAAGVFPESNPGLSDGAYLAMAATAAVFFFASLLLHELGHAVQARREGMELDGITLWIFGGVAKFKGKFPSAGAELRIAVAGPLVSLVRYRLPHLRRAGAAAERRRWRRLLARVHQLDPARVPPSSPGGVLTIRTGQGALLTRWRAVLPSRRPLKRVSRTLREESCRRHLS